MQLIVTGISLLLVPGLVSEKNISPTGSFPSCGRSSVDLSLFTRELNLLNKGISLAKKKSATIRDVAREANVSVATVSHVFNNTRRVSGATRQKVLDAAKRLNYVPSGIARSLSTSRTNLIGMVVADVLSPFFAMIIRGVEDRLWRYGYNLVVCSTDEAVDKESQYLQLLLERRVDGIVVTPTGKPQPMFEELLRHRIRMVFVDRRPPEGFGPVIEIDNVRAGYMAAEHLIKLGHRKIALVTRNPSLSTVQGRTEGYRKALAAYQIPIVPEYMQVIEARVEDAEKAVNDLMCLPQPPSAIIAANHFITLGVLAGLQHLHIPCPEEVSLIGFDDHPWVPVFTPPLTVITHPFNDICDETVQTLLAMLKEHDEEEEMGLEAETQLDGSFPDVILPPIMINRQSCKNLFSQN